MTNAAPCRTVTEYVPDHAPIRQRCCKLLQHRCGCGAGLVRAGRRTPAPGARPGRVRARAAVVRRRGHAAHGAPRAGAGGGRVSCADRARARGADRRAGVDRPHRGRLGGLAPAPAHGRCRHQRRRRPAGAQAAQRGRDPGVELAAALAAVFSSAGHPRARARAAPRRRGQGARCRHGARRGRGRWRWRGPAVVVRAAPDLHPRCAPELAGRAACRAYLAARGPVPSSRPARLRHSARPRGAAARGARRPCAPARAVTRARRGRVRARGIRSGRARRRPRQHLSGTRGR